MNAQRRDRIGAAFDAARDYDAHSPVQARIAASLARRIGTLALPREASVLEVGCGTGHLTEALAREDIGGTWLVTDLAPAMLDRARARLGDSPARRFAVLDGEHGPTPPEAPFDLVCSSLAFQWFEDAGRGAARLMDWVHPGGWLALATLGEATFHEWREAHAALGLQPGTVPLPTPGRIAALFPGAQVITETETETHADARDFLHALKAIGAATPAPGHRPLTPGTLRRVMRTFENAGATATYQAVTVLWQRPA